MYVLHHRDYCGFLCIGLCHCLICLVPLFPRQLNWCFFFVFSSTAKITCELFITPALWSNVNTSTLAFVPPSLVGLAGVVPAATAVSPKRSLPWNQAILSGGSGGGVPWSNPSFRTSSDAALSNSFRTCSCGGLFLCWPMAVYNAFVTARSTFPYHIMLESIFAYAVALLVRMSSISCK